MRDQAGDACTTGDAGKVTVAQLVGLSEDLFGRVGVDSRGVGIGNERRDRCVAYLDIAFDDDDAVVRLDRQASH
ncbi:hypothetical protein D3C80_2127140 [compost metagenome]